MKKTELRRRGMAALLALLLLISLCPAALAADLTGFLTAVLTVRLLFGP